MKKILAIVGPTATGKTDLAIEIAKKLKGELVSVDSRQVYKGLDLGTGKSPSGMPNNTNPSINSGQVVKYIPMSNDKFEKGEGYWVMDGVRVWMYDVCLPGERYHVSQYVKEAEKALEEIERMGKLPILVGGTGFYLRGLLEGFASLNLGVDENLREKLEKSGVGELQKKLLALSPAAIDKMNESDRNNPRRLIRQIEILSNITNPSINSGQVVKYVPMSNDCNVLKIGLTAPRLVLNERIDQRVLSRFKDGMLEEAKQLLKEGLTVERMKSLGLEYRVQAEYLNGEITYEQMVEKLQIKIHQYAKRQMTWFKKDPDIEWFDITESNFREKVEKKVVDWYNS